MRLAIEGIATTQSALTINLPESTSKNFAYVAKQALLLARGGTAGNQVIVNVPVIPANTLRGRIRRIIADIVEARIIAMNQHLSLQSYSALRTGGMLLKNESKAFDVARFRQYVDHVVLGLLGGGPDMRPSRYIVRPGVPVSEVTRRCGLVPDMLLTSEVDIFATNSNDDNDDEADDDAPQDKKKRIGGIIGRTHAVRGDDVADMRDPAAERVVENYDSAVLEYNKELAENRKKRSASKDAESTKDTNGDADRAATQSQRMPYGYEYVVPGVPFFVKVETNPVLELTDAQAGCLIDAVDRLFRTPLGGRIRHGLGRFAVDGLRASIDGVDLGIDNLGNPSQPLAVNHDSHGLPVAREDLPERAQALVRAYRGEFERLTAAELEGMLAPKVAAKRKKTDDVEVA